MSPRHFLSISDLKSDELVHLINTSVALAKGDNSKVRPLEGKAVGIYFRRSSTRTRTSFTVGALKLGAQVIQYGPDDLQVVTGETMQDTGRVLSEFLDCLVFRSNGSIHEMEALACQDDMAIINAMSSNEHPTQSIADLSTIKEALGRLYDVHVLYIGEGNNTAAALARAMSKLPGMQLTLMSPEGYGLPADLLIEVQDRGLENKTVIEQRHDLNTVPKGIDVVYTTRWQTMGEPKTDANWIEKFEPYRVTTEFMSLVSKPTGTIFMHDLPAIRGYDVVDQVLDGPQSVAFRQAHHKLTSAMAILIRCVVGD